MQHVLSAGTGKRPRPEKLLSPSTRHAAEARASCGFVTPAAAAEALEARMATPADRRRKKRVVKVLTRTRPSSPVVSTADDDDDDDDDAADASTLLALIVASIHAITAEDGEEK